MLVDVLEMEPPSDDLALLQWKFNAALEGMKIKRAVVVSNSKLAYLARLAFGEPDLRVFYNDLSGAIKWLGE